MNSRIFRPKHHLGQNFLVDKEVLAKIIQVADLKSSDTVLEVGPGTGVLTRELIKHAGQVIAVEKDPKLYEILKSTISTPSERSESRGRDLGVNSKTSRLARSGGFFTLINQDILRFHLDKYITGPYKVVANIPYYLTSKLLQYFLEQKNPPKLMVLMVQKEVGERVVAMPGELSILGLSVQIYADAEIVAYISKKSFWPIPEVDSVILKIIPKNKYPQIKDMQLFFRIIKIAFAGKRKQIKNTIKNIQALQKAGIDPMSRPQDLTIEQWISLHTQML